MNLATPAVIDPSGTDLADSGVSSAEAAYVAAFARFLSRNVAAVDPANDTRYIAVVLGS